MALSDTKCRVARPTAKLQKLSDGGGLQLWVQPNGSRYWRLAYRYRSKQKVLAIGVYPAVSLAEARRRRDEAKQLLACGTDPADAKRREKVVTDSFRAIAGEYLAKLRREGRAPRTLAKVEWLLSFAEPMLGDRPIGSITAVDVLQVLRTVERRGRYESARRLRSTIGAVFRYAVATLRADSDPTFALRDALIRPTVTPRAAVTDPAAFGGLLRAIEDFDGQPTTRAALKLMALLFPRPGELRAAEWREFDFDKALWTLPVSRMKMRRPHRIPLSRQAIAVLGDLREITGGCALLFPSVRAENRPISDNTLNAALRRLGYAKDEATAHGFRATAATLLNECGKWHPDAIERQLAHVEANDVRRAYVRGEHWAERVMMMQWWADYLDTLKIDRAQGGGCGVRYRPLEQSDEG